METINIDRKTNGTVRSKKVPVFSSKFGVKGIFHVIDNFQIVNLWGQFEDVLDTVTEHKWDNLMTNISDKAHNSDQLYTIFKDFVHLYSKAQRYS